MNYIEEFPKIAADSRAFSSNDVPVNGSSFGPGQQNFVDLPKQSVLLSDSLYISYTLNVVTTGAAGFVESVLAYSPIYRLETIAKGVEICPAIQSLHEFSDQYHSRRLAKSCKRIRVRIYGAC